jgi:ribonucleoside-diphosphate reductase alpha chain
MIKKILKKIVKMSELLKKFAEGLTLSPEMVKSLDIVRNNQELKIFALSLPTLKYPDSYLLAGRIFMYVNIKNCPINIEEYISIANDILRQEIKDFMLKYSKEINQLLEDTYYQNFERYNILSASSCVNYLLKISHEENPIETPCQMFLRQAIQFYYRDSWEEVKQCYYELINQDYVHASPTMFNAGTRKNQMSSCFKAGTKIFTYNRGIVNIEDVQIGDEVKTHKGNIKKVSQLHQNPLGERSLYNIKLNRTFDFDVTDNHRFWAVQAKGENKPKWIPMEYLCVGDYIALPPANTQSKTYLVDMLEGVEDYHKYITKDNWLNISTEYITRDHLNGTNNLIIRQKSNSPIKKEWQADKNWAFFVGAWFGDGNIINKTRNGKKKVHGIRFVAHKSNYQIIERLVKIGKEKTGIEGKINKGTNSNENLYYLDFHSAVLGKYFDTNYGSGFDKKKLDQRMYYWGGQELKSFMTGLFSTDGCWTEKNKLIIQLSNVKLIKDIFYLLRVNGVYARYNFVDKSRNKLATTDSALIELPFEYLQKDEISKHYNDDRMSTKKVMKCSTRRKIIDNQNFVRLDSKTLSLERPEYVYTIGVDDDHSYCIEGIIAENCFLLTLGDNLESLLYSGAGDVGLISKLQGGIGLSMNAVRHSNISNTGKSSGVLPFAKIYDATIKCVNQGGKRNGAMTITLIDWHIDFMDFIQTRDNYTHNGIRFEQANICAYLSRLFMDRVKKDQDWTFFCPAKAKIDGHALLGSHGHKFEEIYEKVEQAAISKKIEFDKLDQTIKEMEKLVNQDGADRKLVLDYHAKTVERIKMRKHLIDYRVMKARDVYNKLCDMNVKSSMPYIVYRDPVNEKNNMANIGPTENLNLCVAPETLVLTDKGHIRIDKLKDQNINVWNGKEFSEVTIKQTGIDQELIKVNLSDGSYLECTPYHKFYIQKLFSNSKLKSDIIKSTTVEIIEAQNLKSNMRLVKCSYPIIDKGEDIDYAYTSGFFTGDGTYNKYKEEIKKCDYRSIENKRYCNRHICYEQDDDESEEFCQGLCYTDKPLVSLYGDKIKLLDKLDYRTKGEEKNNKINLTLNVYIKDKFYVPIDKSLKSKLEWFSGYIDADGCIVSNGDNQSLQVSSINREFLLNVKYMLQTCGCNPKISVATEERKTLLPDGKGGSKEYNCKELYRLLVSSFDLQILLNNGLETHRLVINKRNIQRDANRFITVNEVINHGRRDDTYCFTEPKRNAGIFNGIFTSQCLEISEPSTPDSIASCNLGHLNLKAFVKKSDQKLTLDNLKDFYDFEAMGKATQSLTRNINKVIDYNYYPLDERDSQGKVIKRGKISTPNFDNRPIGIGVSGLAEVFALLDIAYDSPEAFKLNKMIFAAMYYHALYQSRLLALQEGEYNNFRTGECEVFMDGRWQKVKGSPLSNGFFQFNLWQQEADYLKSINRLNSKIYKEEDNEPINPVDWGMDIEKHSWGQLRKDIVQDGVRNSMLIALMPTASSAQLLRNAETTEAHQTLVYSRKLVHGNFTAFSEPFVEDMVQRGLWNKETIDFIMMSNGSIEKLDHFVADNQHIFPSEFYNDGKIRAAKLLEIQHIKNIHRGMYEISQKDTMQMARQRGIYVCQSQSLNIYLPEPDIKKMKAVHTYSNALGLKTGMYYLRANPASQTERFTVDISIQEYHKQLKSRKNNIICTDEVCLMCQ